MKRIAFLFNSPTLRNVSSLAASFAAINRRDFPGMSTPALPIQSHIYRTTAHYRAERNEHLTGPESLSGSPAWNPCLVTVSAVLSA